MLCESTLYPNRLDFWPFGDRLTHYSVRTPRVTPSASVVLDSSNDPSLLYLNLRSSSLFLSIPTRSHPRYRRPRYRCIVVLFARREKITNWNPIAHSSWHIFPSFSTRSIFTQLNILTRKSSHCQWNQIFLSKVWWKINWFISLSLNKNSTSLS